MNNFKEFIVEYFRYLGNTDNPLDIVFVLFSGFGMFGLLITFVVNPLGFFSFVFIRVILAFILCWYIRYLFFKNR